MSGDVMAQTSSLSTERAPGTPPADLSTRPTSTKNKVHKFFNSYPQYERRAADAFAVNGIPLRGIRETGGCAELVIIGQPITVDIPSEGVVDSAHYGYVYAMAVVGESSRDGCDDILPETHKGHLVTGSGDETLKVIPIGRPTCNHVSDYGMVVVEGWEPIGAGAYVRRRQRCHLVCCHERRHRFCWVPGRIRYGIFPLPFRAIRNLK
jgi:hypothetical protein